MAQVRLLTAEDIRDWADDYELHEGVPRAVAAAPRSSMIAARIAYLLTAATIGRPDAGVVFGADASFRLSRFPDILYLPDAAYVQRERVRDKAALAYPFEGSPDLAVEVRSPSDSMAELDAKMARYLAAGSQLGWLVNPTPGTITVYRPGSAALILRGGDRLSGEPVVPGFDHSVDEIISLGGLFP
jgi:Uma2 family endonuclease